MSEFDIPEQSTRTPEIESLPAYRPGARPDRPLRCGDHHPEAGTLVVSASGTLDMAASTAFAESLRRRLESAAATLVLDLSDIEFIDTNGVITLLETAARARLRGVELVLVPSPTVTRLLTLLEVGDRFLHADSVEQATASSTREAARQRSR
ncbi:STAS domain-containing protein [Actinopolyspora mortivallis]|uniref:STAS domain-containing protein n=1 Tax=Actinopolyspora mortivallis TaxID=33906 RepID=UPI00035F550B|nr:STAS domain-containing protein [Actinopolyspora mortivallis]